MTEPAIPTITLTRPQYLIEMVPYLLGFTPHRSLVLIGLDAHTGAGNRPRVTLTVRLDLDLDAAPHTGQLHQATRPLQRSGTASVIAVLFLDHSRNPVQDEHTLKLTAVLRDALRAVQIDLRDVLAANARRWWSITCPNDGCCPTAGTPRIGDSLEARQAGLTAAEDRESLLSVLNPDESRPELRMELAQAEQRNLGDPKTSARRRRDDIALITAETRRHQDDPARRLTAGQLARIAVALTDLVVRDEIWLRIEDRSLNAGAVLLQLATRLPGRYTAAPLFLYGWIQWRAGSGTLAAEAAARALQADPDYSAARLLQTALAEGLNPGTTPRLREPETTH
jgi:hypothetical protein